ncbi:MULTISPECIES: hypothetical protein [Halorubrum]|jgi:hypothetical protein|uniref:Uncharacterized protein n=1 Tax=Halorubrum tropicale TaxID=1765655 RepID=A0A0M9ARN8_9EURY|nr:MULTISPECIES: hypothetical protein [Halorubrum]KOX97487.1 hypothetical protein AMR74_00845 [Halorubrum tropicale]RLM50318.1 hypothetical protein DVK06_11825 [Halorubrum sp. Atlit-28R]TKX42146.1 hypothetical protein EXE50_15465 [Halorubrum sp. ARQ200]TKX49337.1 hypothetical protein EXE49_12450 [Halorubrum sp. ASP121]
MTQKESGLTRREALAGAGAVGFAALGAASGRPTGTDSWGEYTDYTYAQTDRPWDLLVGWRRTENGTVVDSSPTDAEDDVEAAGIRLVDVDNALPHDAGTASVGLRLEDPAGAAPDGVRVWLKIGSALDDADAASRALADRIRLEVRYDTGLLGVGACAGAESDFAGYGELIAAGTLAELSAAPVATGIELDPTLLGNGCLTTEERRCLTFTWEFDGEGGNAGQGGAVDFDVRFAADDCSAEGNPFAMSDATGGDAAEVGQ